MSKSKKPRKAYNPNATLNRAKVHFANKCYLFRWWSKGATGEFATSSGGRLSDNDTITACEYAMKTTRQWIVMVHSCFVSGDDYYERAEMFISDPVALAHNAAALNDQIEEAVTATRAAGNPLHYYDTVAVLRPLSDRALNTADDDRWLTRQAEYRADAVMNQAMIERLSSHNIPRQEQAA